VVMNHVNQPNVLCFSENHPESDHQTLEEFENFVLCVSRRFSFTSREQDDVSIVLGQTLIGVVVSGNPEKVLSLATYGRHKETSLSPLRPAPNFQNSVALALQAR
jgi:hypothetical protein